MYRRACASCCAPKTEGKRLEAATAPLFIRAQERDFHCSPLQPIDPQLAKPRTSNARRKAGKELMSNYE